MPIDPDFNSGEAPFDFEAALTPPDEPVEEPAEEPAEPTLDDLDGDTRAVVEQYLAREREKQRHEFQQLGLDLNVEGRPLVADREKVAGWAGVPAAAPAPAYPPLAPAPAPPAPAPPEPEPELDPLSADAAAYERWLDRKLSERLKPLMERNQHLEGLIQRRAESEAMTRVRSTVEQYMPELSAALDHPDFEGEYRRQLAQVPAELLENPVTIASLAGMVRAQLDPSRMPQRAPAPTEQQLRYQAARASVAQTPPARGGAPPRTPADPNLDLGARFLDHFRNELSQDARKNLPPSREAYEDAAHNNIEDWKRARAARAAATTRRR